MSALVENALVVITATLGVPVLTFTLLVIAALLPWRKPKIYGRPLGNVAVLIPAHNEEKNIGQAVTSVKDQIGTADRVVVIADNCTDSTARLALAHGAEVTVRNNKTLRGKGYALEHGIDYLEAAPPPDVVIVLDADCEMKGGTVDELAGMCIRENRPVQAAYLMNSPASKQKKAHIICFAWKVKNFVRPLGWRRLGMPCQLAGSGMAFPWRSIRSVRLADDCLAEDLKLGLEFALVGQAPLFCANAVVRSDVARDGDPSPSQRARWEHGTISVSLKYIPRLSLAAFRDGRIALMAMILDLFILPLGLLSLLLGSNLVLAIVCLCATGRSAPLSASSTLCFVFLFAIALAWARHGRTIVPVSGLVLAPVYALCKIPLYVRYVVCRQREWVRGTRS